MIRRQLASTCVAAITALLALTANSAAPQPKAPAQICLNDSGNCATKPVGSGVKWHPGHYMLTYKASPQSNMDAIKDEPYVLGAVRRYYWAQLEPSEGVYDFSLIESDLKYLKSMPTPKRLVIQIFDRGHHSQPSPIGVVPNYLLEDARFGGKTGWYAEKGARWYGVAPAILGPVARTWDPVVMDRWIALFKALAARFDNEPYLEAVSGNDTTPGIRRTSSARLLERKDGHANQALDLRGCTGLSED